MTLCKKSQDEIITTLQDIIDNTHEEDYLLLIFGNGEERDGKLQCGGEVMAVMENRIQWQEDGHNKSQTTEELVPSHLCNIHAKHAQSCLNC